MAPIYDNWHHFFIISLIFISLKSRLLSSPSPDCFAISLRSCAVKILLCRCSAQKIETDSGKKLQKNNIKPKKIQPKITTRTTVIPKTKPKTQNAQPKTPSPYDPQNPYKEPQSDPKDITWTSKTTDSQLLLHH